MEEWSVNEVCDQLSKNGVSTACVALFKENMVDGPTLAALQKKDLKEELEIKALGDRKTVWEVVQRLQEEAVNPVEAAQCQDAVPQEAAPVPDPPADVQEEQKEEQEEKQEEREGEEEPKRGDQEEAVRPPKKDGRRVSIELPKQSQQEAAAELEKSLLEELADDVAATKKEIHNILCRSPILDDAARRQSLGNSSRSSRSSLGRSLSKTDYQSLLSEQAQQNDLNTQSYEAHATWMKEVGFRS